MSHQLLRAGAFIVGRRLRRGIWLLLLAGHLGGCRSHQPTPSSPPAAKAVQAPVFRYAVDEHSADGRKFRRRIAYWISSKTDVPRVAQHNWHFQYACQSFRNRTLTEAALSWLVKQVRRGKIPGVSFTRLRIPSCKLPPRTFAYLRQMQGLKYLDLSGRELSVADIEAIAEIKTLEHLVIRRAKLTDEQLRPIFAMPALKGLRLDSPQLTDGGLAGLSRLTSLRYLELSGRHVTQKTISHLPPGLSDLDLSDTCVERAASRQLSRLTSLKRLRLMISNADQLAEIGDLQKLEVLFLRAGSSATSCSAVSGESLRHLQRLKRLRMLVLPCSNLSASDLARIGRLRGLTELELSGVQGQGLRHLASLRQLRTLRLGLSEEKHLALLALLPALESLELHLDFLPSARGIKMLQQLPRLQSLSLKLTAEGSMCRDAVAQICASDSDLWKELCRDRPWQPRVVRGCGCLRCP